MKKVLSVFSVVFIFMGSSLNLNASAEEALSRECFDFARLVYQGSIDRGLDRDYAAELATWAYSDCLKWDD